MNYGNLRQEEKRIPLNICRKALTEPLTFFHFYLPIVYSPDYLILHSLSALQKKKKSLPCAGPVVGAEDMQ